MTAASEIGSFGDTLAGLILLALAKLRRRGKRQRLETSAAMDQELSALPVSTRRAILDYTSGRIPITWAAAITRLSNRQFAKLCARVQRRAWLRSTQ